MRFQRWQPSNLCHESLRLMSIEDSTAPTHEARPRPPSSTSDANSAPSESEQLYTSLFDHMLNGLAYCRMLYEGDRPVDFIYLSVNQAFGAQTGLQDVVGHRVSEVIPGIREADPELFEIYGRVARGGPPETFETYVEALQMWFEISIYSPKPEHFVAVFDVITERKLAEMALRSSEERFATVFQASPVGIVISKGYSSLAYLRRFPIDTLKIDQSFMRDIPHDESAIEITKTIIALGQNLHMQVLAEGVETEAQFRFLKSLSCNLSQGNLHSRPVVAAALADFLANNR